MIKKSIREHMSAMTDASSQTCAISFKSTTKHPFQVSKITASCFCLLSCPIFEPMPLPFSYCIGHRSPSPFVFLQPRYVVVANTQVVLLVNNSTTVSAPIFFRCLYQVPLDFLSSIAPSHSQLLSPFNASTTCAHDCPASTCHVNTALVFIRITLTEWQLLGLSLYYNTRVSSHTPLHFSATIQHHSITPALVFGSSFVLLSRAILL